MAPIVGVQSSAKTSSSKIARAAFQENNRVYLVMNYLHGASLQQCTVTSASFKHAQQHIGHCGIARQRMPYRALQRCGPEGDNVRVISVAWEKADNPACAQALAPRAPGAVPVLPIRRPTRF